MAILAVVALGGLFGGRAEATHAGMYSTAGWTGTQSGADANCGTASQCAGALFDHSLSTLQHNNNTGGGALPWVTVDMGSALPVGNLVIWNRDDFAPGNWSNNAKVERSLDGSSWTVVHSGSVSCGVSCTFAINENVRHWRFSVTASVNLHLKDMDVYAPSATFTPTATQTPTVTPTPNPGTAVWDQALTSHHGGFTAMFAPWSGTIANRFEVPAGYISQVRINRMWSGFSGANRLSGDVPFAIYLEGNSTAIQTGVFHSSGSQGWHTQQLDTALQVSGSQVYRLAAFIGANLPIPVGESCAGADINYVNSRVFISGGGECDWYALGSAITYPTTAGNLATLSNSNLIYGLDLVWSEQDPALLFGATPTPAIPFTTPTPFPTPTPGPTWAPPVPTASTTDPGWSVPWDILNWLRQVPGMVLGLLQQLFVGDGQQATVALQEVRTAMDVKWGGYQLAYGAMLALTEYLTYEPCTDWPGIVWTWNRDAESPQEVVAVHPNFCPMFAYWRPIMGGVIFLASTFSAARAVLAGVKYLSQ